MKKIEFENYKKHLLGYMTEQEIVDQAKESIAQSTKTRTDT